MESSAPEGALFQFLDNLVIPHTTYRHPPVFTVEEAQKERAYMPSGGHSKNLFIRDKKKQYALVVASENRQINLKALGETIGLSHPSFANADRLHMYLGVAPGSVTPFALLHARRALNPDHPGMHVILDKTLMAHDVLFFHPLHNSATTAVSPAGLITFIRACGYEPDYF